MLWRMVLDGPDRADNRISARARKTLVDLHVLLADELLPRRTDVRQALLQ
jgi:hypothetical protein